VRELRNIVIRLCTKYAGQSVTPDQLEAELDSDTAMPSDIPLASDAKALYELARKQLQSQNNFNLDYTMKQWKKVMSKQRLT